MKRLPTLVVLTLLSGVAFGQPTAPTISVSTGDRTVTVSWAEPTGATIGSTFDVAYIASSNLSPSRGVRDRGRVVDRAERFGPRSDTAAWTELPALAVGKGSHYVVLPRVLTNDMAYTFKVAHTQASVQAWSPVVEATPADPGDSSNPVTLTYGQVVGGVVGRGDIDSFTIAAEGKPRTICYVRSPGGYEAISVFPDYGWDDLWDSKFGDHYRMFINRDFADTRRFDVRNHSGNDDEYEILCRKTPDASTLAEAAPLDLNFPSDVEFSEKGDSYFYTFRLPRSGAYAIATYGVLDTVLKLYDSDGTLLRSSDDGWQVGNVSNALVLEELIVDEENAAEEGIFHVEVLFPYTERARDHESSIPLLVFPATGGGVDAASAAPLHVGRIETQGAKVYFDMERPPVKYGNLTAAGEEDYWSFEARWTFNYILIRGVGNEDSGLTAELVGYPAPYLRAGLLRGGSGADGPVGVVTIAARVPRGSYVLKVSSSNDTEAGGPYAVAVVMDHEAHAAEFGDGVRGQACDFSVPEGVSDRLFKCQWHLSKGESGDIKVQEAWEAGYTGDGIEIAIVDEGIDTLHPDLTANVDTLKNLNFIDGSNDPFEPIFSHGTAVAGTIGAAANETGVRGVAYEATLYNFNFLGAPTYVREATAMTRDVATRGVSNHSYGFPDDGRIWRSHPTWNASLDAMLKQGFGGLGTSYVNSAGNGGAMPAYNAVEGEYTHFDEYNSHVGGIPVCAVGQNGKFIGDTSEQGTNLWVCGASYGDPDYGNQGIFTTSQFGRWRYDFGGTSVAAPVVSGVVGLIREANSALTWRDVKLVLAESARRVDPDHEIRRSNGDEPGWVSLGAGQYGGDGTYSYSKQYGFGLVDAQAAVELAEDWVLLPELKVVSSCLADPVGSSAYFLYSNGSRFLRAGIEIENSGIDFIEYVEFTFDMRVADHSLHSIWVGGPDAVVGAVHPQWIEVSALEPVQGGSIDGSYRVAVNQFVGLPADGVWKLATKNQYWRSAAGGTRLYSWGVRIYGHDSEGNRVVATNNGADSVDYVTPTPCSRAGVAARRLALDPVSASVVENAVWMSDTPVLGGVATGAVTWTLSGDDAGDFTVDATTGVVTLPAQDFENPADADADNVYEASLTATDEDSRTGSASVEITVTDDETDLELEAISGTVAENAVWTSPTPTVTGASTGTLTWTLGGDDAAYFAVAASTGVLTLSARDFEAPLDANADNVYEATLTVTDGAGAAASAAVAVTVTDDANEPTTTLSLQNGRFEAQVSWKTDVGDAPSRAFVEVSRQGSGIFSFRQIGDWSLLLSVQDGCDFTGGIWVIASDVPSQPTASDYDLSLRSRFQDRLLNKAEYPLWTVTVRDTETGNTVELTNHPEDLVNPDGRRSAVPVRITATRRAFPDVCTTSSGASSSLPVKVPTHLGRGLAPVAQAAVADASASTSCGLEGRSACLHNKFDVLVDWRSWDSASNREPTTLVEANGSAAAFSFHHPEVIDAVVKISEQCANVNAPLDDRRGYFVSVGATVIHDGLQARVMDTRISGNAGFLRWWDLMGAPFDPSRIRVGRGDVFERPLNSNEAENRIACIR